MLLFSVVTLLVCMSLMLFRVVSADTLYDRILAVNVFSACGIMMVMILGVVVNASPFFLDVCLVYACVGLVSALAFAKFFRGGWRDGD